MSRKPTVGRAVDWGFAATVGAKLTRPEPATTDYTRNQVREQLAAGKDKDDVIDYLVERYGDFVLYEPPFNAATGLLWVGPFALLLGGAGWLAWRLRRRRSEIAADGALSAADRERARALLAGGGDAASNPASPESRK